MGLQRVRHNWVTFTSPHLQCTGYIHQSIQEWSEYIQELCCVRCITSLTVQTTTLGIAENEAYRRVSKWHVNKQTPFTLTHTHTHTHTHILKQVVLFSNMNGQGHINLFVVFNFVYALFNLGHDGKYFWMKAIGGGKTASSIFHVKQNWLWDLFLYSCWWTLGCFQFTVVTNKAVMSICVIKKLASLSNTEQRRRFCILEISKSECDTAW